MSYNINRGMFVSNMISCNINWILIAVRSGKNIGIIFKSDWKRLWMIIELKILQSKTIINVRKFLFNIFIMFENCNNKNDKYFQEAKLFDKDQNHIVWQVSHKKCD